MGLIRPPVEEYVISKISQKYNSLIFIGLTNDDRTYIRLDHIYLINKKFLFVNDTGYGTNYTDACKNLIDLFMDATYRIRYDDSYATTSIRTLIKKIYKKYGMEYECNNTV